MYIVHGQDSEPHPCKIYVGTAKQRPAAFASYLKDIKDVKSELADLELMKS